MRATTFFYVCAGPSPLALSYCPGAHSARRILRAMPRAARILLTLILAASCGCAAPTRLAPPPGPAAPRQATMGPVATGPTAPPVATRTVQVDIPHPVDPDDPIVRERAQRMEELIVVGGLIVGLLLMMWGLTRGGI